MNAHEAWTTHKVQDISIADGVTLRTYQAGEGYPVVLLHGFPELAYSWRHQLPFLAAHGYRAIAPDQRGYGGSGRPEPIEAYDLDHLAGDVIGLLDALDQPEAVVIGHDWGAPVAWHTALSYPGRIRGVGSLSVPHAQRGNRRPLESMRALAGPDHIFYIDYFQQPGVADAELAADVRGNILGFMWCISGDAPPEERFRPIRNGARFVDSFAPPDRLPPWLGEDELNVYVEAFRRTGFTGGLNWYRNVDRNWERSERLAGARVEQPALFVTGSEDPARNPAAMERLPEVVPNLLVNEVLPGCGHWTQQESPDEVNRLLLEFLQRAGIGSR